MAEDPSTASMADSFSRDMHVVCISGKHYRLAMILVVRKVEISSVLAWTEVLKLIGESREWTESTLW